MISFLRHSVIRFGTPLIWKLFPNRKVQAIFQFSLIEKDSGLQLLQCFHKIEDPEIRADLLQHVLEELFHADLFEELSKDYSSSYINTPVIPREYYLTPDSTRAEIVDFYSYAHVGESDVNEDFAVYSKSSLEKKDKKLFARISADESRHEVGTNDILLKLCQGDKFLYRKLILKSKLKRLYKQFSAQMKQIGVIPLSIILTSLYFLFGPFIFLYCRKRLTLSAEDQLEIFKHQIKSQSERVL